MGPVPSLAVGLPQQRLALYTLGGYGVYMVGYAVQKEDLLRRLKRVEGQVRGLQQMVEDDRYCIDVLTQISAATKALQSVAIGMFDDHLRHCVADALATGGSEADLKLTEASAAVERLLKS
jgi:DNA-binding FrmR family transcriptional regulator